MWGSACACVELAITSVCVGHDGWLEALRVRALHSVLFAVTGMCAAYCVLLTGGRACASSSGFVAFFPD
jgi:hypothetical protein